VAPRGVATHGLVDRDALAELHFLTSIENLVSIVEHGILSHERAARLPHVDLSNPAIQDLRKGKAVAYAGQARARKLHSYANLFLHGRNSMLKDLCYSHCHRAVAVLAVGLEVLDLPGVVIADQNAASKYVRFHASPDGLEHLHEGYVLAREWGDQNVDQIDYWRRKSRRSAEVLVPDRIDSRYLRRAYVSCEGSYKRVRALALPLDVSIDPDLFFRS
jgi:hypothetical protein